ncbi:hypothetical protein BCR34DRAFT_295081 [Clohesyomyces aquaticus]|uniref:Uncharacterized protein n=1 Tax=Clohesyomyces aquaticus TaxID=1231657 RepID=A0A1Y2A926_9PLEO|nr:hypothetical protein BCR34DRAFT_295081 [Clohesyomyces aquaticus]
MRYGETSKFFADTWNYYALLSEAIVWVFWPQCGPNVAGLFGHWHETIAIAERNYPRRDPELVRQSEDLIRDFPLRTHDWVGGVAMLQKPGETICVPPFCPTMRIHTRTTTTVSYQIRTYDKILDLLCGFGISLEFHNLLSWSTFELADNVHICLAAILKG